MRIECLLIVIVALLTLISVLGVGVAIGGGNEANAATYLNAFSAVSAAVSSLSALGTFFLLIYVRNDWLKPKEYDVKNEFKYALIEWQDTISSMNLYLSGIRQYSDIDKSIAYVETLVYKENEAWLNIRNVLNKYIIFFPESILKRSSLTSIHDLRCRVVVCAHNYIKYISELDVYPVVSQPFSEIDISKDIKSKCSTILEMI
ncbi:hypothetical protein VCSRO97_3491 [Vibrio cholerae]|nr:hypothetical protein VCSRO97_3491 [Vibrio cholerae]